MTKMSVLETYTVFGTAHPFSTPFASKKRQSPRRRKSKKSKKSKKRRSPRPTPHSTFALIADRRPTQLSQSGRPPTCHFFLWKTLTVDID